MCSSDLMVLIKRGSFEMGPSDKDSLWGFDAEMKGVSFEAFWMDEMEITNGYFNHLRLLPISPISGAAFFFLPLGVSRQAAPQHHASGV